jgi:hypothetical protein
MEANDFGLFESFIHAFTWRLKKDTKNTARVTGNCVEILSGNITNRTL